MPTEAGDLMDALVQTSFTVMGVLTRVGAANDLSLTQLRVLAILRDRRCRMSELADHLGLDKSTMSGLVARAEQRGLWRRAPSADDGRAIDVLLTAAGKRLGDHLTWEVTGALDPRLGALTAVERRRLVSLLQRVFDTA